MRFKAGDLGVNQLLDITYQIFSSLHDNYEIRGYSLTFQKLSIKCGTRKFLINLNATGPQGIS